MERKYTSAFSSFGSYLQWSLFNKKKIFLIFYDIDEKEKERKFDFLRNHSRWVFDHLNGQHCGKLDQNLKKSRQIPRGLPGGGGMGTFGIDWYIIKKVQTKELKSQQKHLRRNIAVLILSTLATAKFDQHWATSTFHQHWQQIVIQN